VLGLDDVEGWEVEVLQKRVVLDDIAGRRSGHEGRRRSVKRRSGLAECVEAEGEGGRPEGTRMGFWELFKV